MRSHYDLSRAKRRQTPGNVKFDTPSYTIYVKVADLTNFVYPEQESALFVLLTERTGLAEPALRKSLNDNDLDLGEFVIAKVK